MTIVWNGIIRCPKCGKYFEAAVSYFIDLPKAMNSRKAFMIDEIKSHQNPEQARKFKDGWSPGTRKCPYCKAALVMEEWQKCVVYNPTLRINKMSLAKIRKAQPKILRQDGSESRMLNKLK